MKIRSGFVSNSSSSSFIVTLPKKIEEYTLEEFRKLIYTDKYDPVAVLYRDLCDTENSHRNFDEWEQEYYDVNQLDDTQYIVQYGNECDGNYYLQDLMEYYFMPNLEDYSKSIEVIQRSCH